MKPPDFREGFEGGRFFPSRFSVFLVAVEILFVFFVAAKKKKKKKKEETHP